MKWKLFEYLKYRKIINYLKSKDEREYNCLDSILKYYIEGHLERLLNNYGFSKIECFFEIWKKVIV